MGKHLMKGDPVIISFDPHDNCVVEDMRRFNGLQTIISKVHANKVVTGRLSGPQYELKGVVSKIGNIPYIFTKDMLAEEVE